MTQKTSDDLQTALRASEEKFSAAFEQSPLALAISSIPDGRLVEVNEGFVRLSGYSREEALGHSIGDLQLWVDAEQRRQGIAELLAGARIYAAEARFRTKSGEERVGLIGATIIYIGSQPHILASVADITERKQMEVALRESEQLARTALEAQQRLTAELQAADARKDQFLAMLAHELRNPLAPIKNAAQMVALLAPADPRLMHAREIIDRQTDHLTRMVDDLLDVSRVTRGKIELKRESIRLQRVVDRAIEMAQPLMQERRHTLSAAPADQDLYIQGDFDRLVQVLSNVLVNAAKFTPPGGQILLRTEGADGDARITVRDTGVGLTPVQCERIFDIFAQEDQSLARSQGGLGIGLTLVKRLVEMHGGHISVHSPGVGQGSEFVIDLPVVATQSSSESQRNERSLPLQSSALKILVVEDNPDSAASLMALFEVCGHIVRVAPDAFAALDLVETFSPDIAFIDIGLPGLDGYELGERLRVHPHCRNTLLVALTGYGRPEDKQRSRQIGFHHHLTKPVQFAAINGLLAEASSAQRH